MADAVHDTTAPYSQTQHDSGAVERYADAFRELREEIEEAVFGAQLARLAFRRMSEGASRVERAKIRAPLDDESSDPGGRRLVLTYDLVDLLSHALRHSEELTAGLLDAQKRLARRAEGGSASAAIAL